MCINLTETHLNACEEHDAYKLEKTTHLLQNRKNDGPQSVKYYEDETKAFDLQTSHKILLG